MLSFYKRILHYYHNNYQPGFWVRFGFKRISLSGIGNKYILSSHTKDFVVFLYEKILSPVFVISIGLYYLICKPAPDNKLPMGTPAFHAACAESKLPPMDGITSVVPSGSGSTSTKSSS